MQDQDREGRPSPDALLAEAKRDERGRLKIFLGAAPGVGTTFAMLEAAQERRREGVDVAVGVVETHGRRETQALLDGLEVLPRQTIDYRGRSFAEMDLDAVLRRRPAILLVDELAHTNIPGSRHIKRWQDVDEILAAGIDVYSTLNIQHLESLNDVVERIAGVKVRETLPDSVLRGADDIEIIDLSPDDLLKRLAEGKVYVPEQARRAVHNFFSRGNLTALRELALRHAAERVDAQMLDYMRAHAVEGPWPTRERILVCVGANTAATRVVRTAKRAADRTGAPWTAVYVETHRHGDLREEAKDQVAQALRLAEQLGGETTMLQGDDVAGQVLRWARDHNVTLIMVGRRHRKVPRWFASRSVSAEILRRAGGVDIIVVGGEAESETPKKIWDRRRSRRPVGWQGMALAAAAVAAVAGAGWLAEPWLPPVNIAVAFLVLILVVAIRLGLQPAIAASVASFLAFNFLFTESRLSLKVTDPKNALTLVFFLTAAVITSNLAGRARAQMQMARHAVRRTTTLYEFSRRVAQAVTQDDVLWTVVHHVAAMIHGHSLVLLPRDGTLEIRAGYPPEDFLEERDRGAAEWTWSHGVPAGRGSTTLPAASWLFLPMHTTRGAIGVLGVRIEGNDAPPTPEQSRLLEALAGQAALAIERTNLVGDVEAASLTAATDRLRSAVLSSLSKELTTPIASIVAAAGRLVAADAAGMAADERKEAAVSIQEEAERLEHFVQNLIDMNRLGTGGLHPGADWTDLNAIVADVLDRAQKLLKGRRVLIDIDPELPRLRVDRVMMEQVFFNLIDNACKYSPPDSRIVIWSRRRGDKLLVEVSDEGPGIPPEEREKVFDMFYRADGAGGGIDGLGLAVCRGIIEAHGGRIRVESGLNDVGASICMQLPLPGEEADEGAIADATGDGARLQPADPPPVTAPVATAPAQPAAGA